MTKAIFVLFLIGITLISLAWFVAIAVRGVIRYAERLHKMRSYKDPH